MDHDIKNLLQDPLSNEIKRFKNNIQAFINVEEKTTELMVQMIISLDQKLKNQ